MKVYRQHVSSVFQLKRIAMFISWQTQHLPAVHKLSFASPVTLFPSSAPKLWIISIHGSYDLSSTFNSISVRCLHFQLLAYISRIFSGKHYMHFLYFPALFFLSGRLWSKLAIPSYRFFFFPVFYHRSCCTVLHHICTHLKTRIFDHLEHGRLQEQTMLF